MDPHPARDRSTSRFRVRHLHHQERPRNFLPPSVPTQAKSKLVSSADLGRGTRAEREGQVLQSRTNHTGCNLMTDRVLLQIDNHIARVTLNRPRRHNALDLPMFDALIETGRTLATRRDVRAVVLHGNGPSFCSGLDYATVMADGDKAIDWLLTVDDDGAANRAQAAPLVWRDLPMPVIAAVHGAVFGGGLQLAAAADIRIAAPDARLSIMETKYGLIPDMGITTAYANQVALDIIKELTFTGRIVEATEAQALGLVTRVAEDPLGAAHTLATAIATRSPDAVRAAKALFDQAWAGNQNSGLRLEAALQRRMFASRNQTEAVAAALERRDPEFHDPES